MFPAKHFAELSWHVTRAKWAGRPLHFGKALKNRFDDPKGKYGILYAGPDLTTAFVESVFHNRKLDFTVARIVSVRFLNQWVVKSIVVRTPLKLADLTARFALFKVGHDADTVANRTGRYRRSQELSRKIYQHPEGFDGLYWFSRQAVSVPCVALFDRCATKLDYKPPDIPLLAHPHFPEVKTTLGLIVKP